MRLALLLTLAVVLAGCHAPDPSAPSDGAHSSDAPGNGVNGPPQRTPEDRSGWADERPVGWNETPQLESAGGFRAHSADQTHHWGPPADDAPAPASCIAYQNGAALEGDTCTIQGPYERFGETYGPWTIRATWNGSDDDLEDEEQDPTRRTVVAFDAAGAAVAHAPQAVPDVIE